MYYPYNATELDSSVEGNVRVCLSSGLLIFVTIFLKGKEEN
jgi:hypothetical protein